MALGPSVPSTAFVVVYNPSQYIHTIAHGQNPERIEALKHLLDCLTQSDIDLITLGSVWLCVAGLLTNEEQLSPINGEIRQCALKCILELIKIEQLQRRFFNLWLSFDFLARYKIEGEHDADLWLECFYTLTNNGKRMDLVDDRLRARLLIQLINGVLTGRMSRNHQVNRVLDELLTASCHLRYDEMQLIMEHIFDYLNRDEDTTNLNPRLYQQSIKKSFGFLRSLVDHQVWNTALLQYFIQNIVDLHDKYTFPTVLNTELLQLITYRPAKTSWHSISVISVLCGIIMERLETPTDTKLDRLSTLLFVLTQASIDIYQHRSLERHQVQLSAADIIHQKCLSATIQQIPICWLTVLHQVLVKLQNVNATLINFHQFLSKLNVKQATCALQLFDMTAWKMMDEIMRICYKSLIIDQKSTAAVRTMYEHCLVIFEDLANKLCCLPHTMVAHLFDIKRLTSISKTTLREAMIKQSYTKLLRLIRPHNPGWSLALREVIEDIILNANEAVTTRIDVLSTVFDRHLWFKMTDQVTTMGQVILDALNSLINVDLSALSEEEFLTKHAVMKQNALKSIFEQFLSDRSIDASIAEHCYRIIQTIYEQDSGHVSSNQSIHRPLLETILEQMYSLFEHNLGYTRRTSFNHGSFILNFFLRQCSANYSKIVTCIQPKVRLLIWQVLLNIRVRPSDSSIGMLSAKTNLTVYGRYRLDVEHKPIENENLLELQDYLVNAIDWLRSETPEIVSVVLNYLCNFLKEQSTVRLSALNIEQLIPFLINTFHDDLLSKTVTSPSLHCLLVCTCYDNYVSHVDSILNCFMEAVNSSKPSFVAKGIKLFTICLLNHARAAQPHIPRMIAQFTKKSDHDTLVTESILEFFMHLLFDNFNDASLTAYIFQILIDTLNQYPNQTAHNLILSHTLLCFYFKQLPQDDRQLFAYFILRSLQQTVPSRSCEPTSMDRPARLHRSGSLSSLNDDMHTNDVFRRKMTVLDAAPAMPMSMVASEENNPLKKLNDELLRITINYVNDHLSEDVLPDSVLILLPREVRRHHLNHSWLADEKILYQIQSYDFSQSNSAKDLLSKLTHEFDDATKNRFRRYTDGHKHSSRRNKDLQILTTCQDDLHIQSLELDTNRSLFNDRNLWIAVTVRSSASTKTFLAINLMASPGMSHTKNEQLHWFEAIKLSDTSADKLQSTAKIANYALDEQTSHSFNEPALKSELKSIVANVDRKDEENLLNRHNENYYPQTVHRVPSDARKSIESIDNVDPVRVAKIGVVYIHAEQKITELDILSNIRTSPRYKQFMSAIATLKSIEQLERENFYRPLLDSNSRDHCGHYAYVWQNPVYQVLFHTSTMLPNMRSDHEFKKKLIGNDYVIIAYNENDQTFDEKALKTGVCQYIIEVCPQTTSQYTRVRLIKRSKATASSNPSSPDATGPKDVDHLISDEHVASYVRTLALCLCQQSELETRQRTSSSLPFAIAPWQTRLQAFRSLHTRCCLSYGNRQ